MDRTAAVEEVAVALIAKGHRSFITADGELGVITHREVSLLPGCSYLDVQVHIGDEHFSFDIPQQYVHRGAPIFRAHPCA